MKSREIMRNHAKPSTRFHEVQLGWRAAGWPAGRLTAENQHSRSYLKPERRSQRGSCRGESVSGAELFHIFINDLADMIDGLLIQFAEETERGKYPWQPH